MHARLVTIFALVSSLAPAVRAGSVDNRNNNSAEFIRNVSRNAATEGADVSIYNPAGAVKLADGLHLSLANQTVAKFNEHRFAPTATAAKIAFQSDIVSPVYPTAFAVYKKDAWAAYAAFSFPGGGGELEYEKGSGTTYPLVTNLQFQGLKADAYLRSVYYGGTVGGSYLALPWLSVSAAARTIYARTEITVDGGKNFAPGNTSKIIDHLEEAQGYTGMAGVDFFPMTGLTLAIRYEAITPLKWEVQKSSLNMDEVIKDKTTRDGYIAKLRAVLRASGQKFDRDLPAVLGLGAGYQLMPALRADLSMNTYFNTMADWDGKENDHENGYEFALGSEYAASGIPLKASLSGMYTISGADSKSYNVENPALDSWTIGLGGHYGVGRHFGVSAGWAGNFAIADDANFTLLNTTANLEKHVLIYSLGVDYHL